MGGYDPKVIKNREKLHFFFRPPLFLPSLLGKTKGFRCKSTLHSCESVATSSPSSLIFLRFSPSFFVKSPSLSLKRWTFSKYLALGTKQQRHFRSKHLRHFRSKSPWSSHKNPLRMRCRGDYSSCFGADALKDAQRHRSRRGGIRSRRGNISTLLHRKISGTSISSACKRANRSSPSAVSEKRILRLSSLHICRLMSLSASAEAITLEALELVSPRASATSPAVCEERALRVQSSIASLRFKS